MKGGKVYFEELADVSKVLQLPPYTNTKMVQSASLPLQKSE